jgi:hypothetical protein
MLLLDSAQRRHCVACSATAENLSCALYTRALVAASCLAGGTTCEACDQPACILTARCCIDMVVQHALNNVLHNHFPSGTPCHTRQPHSNPSHPRPSIQQKHCRGWQDGAGRRARKPDPQPCPIQVDEDGNLKIKATIFIMRENAGAVIGHRGDHVAQVRQESGSFVHVCEPNYDTGAQARANS